MNQQEKQRIRFLHPLRSTTLEMELPKEICFREITGILYENGFITKKTGGYHYIIDGRVCGQGLALENYIPEPAPELLDIKIHGLLIVLT